jgi:hypothetical protein
MKATLRSEDRVVLEQTEVTFEDTPDISGEPADWRGTLLLGEGEYLEPGLYELELEDGQSGLIVITYTPSRPGPMRIYFRGTGEPE